MTDEEKLQRRHETQKRYREKRGEKLLLQKRQWYLDNKETNLEKKKQYYQEHAEECRKRSKRNKEEKPEYYRAWIRTTARRYRNARSTAKRRNKEFTITLEEYTNLVSMDCYYCNGYFGKVEVGSGLDRIDSDKGYEPGNCCSCCVICNRLKQAVFTQEETKLAIQAIIDFRESKKIKE